VASPARLHCYGRGVADRELSEDAPESDVGSDLSVASDASLVISISRWEEAALAEVYRRHAGAVYGLARRVLSNVQVAEEVVQDIFLRLWSNPQRFDPARGSLRSFLLTQTHGRAVDLLRSDSSRRLREEREARQTAGAGYDIEHEVWDLTVAEQLRDVVTALPAAERAAIELAYFGGHTYREVATILSQPEGTIKGRIRTGLQRMHGALVNAGIATEGGEQ
jgi:RNA polymerase sigma-70 factor, ECF subfamily